MDQDALTSTAVRLAAGAIADPRAARLDGLQRPGKEEVGTVIRALIGLIYPGFFDFRPVADTGPALASLMSQELRGIRESLELLACRAIRHTNTLRREEIAQSGENTYARLIVDRFMPQLPAIRDALSLDAQAAADGDPACHSTDEAILCMGGLHAVTVHRLASALDRAGCPLIPRIMAEHVKDQTGVDIHPRAHIGKSFFIDHGVGVVIGETAVIGDHCKIYQGVTLGAKSLPSDDNGRVRREEKRHPTLEDHVTVYAGATILGGNTIIGAGSVIGGGVFITDSVPPGQLVLGPKPEITLRKGKSRPPANFQI